MYDIKQAFQIARQNFTGWYKNPRIYITFILAAILCLLLSDQIISHAMKFETSIQLFEPFIWTYGDAGHIMLSSLILLLLFSDMPFVNQATPYWLVRTKRSVWLAGQLIYVILTTLIYNVFIFVILGIMSAPFAFVGNVWSKTAAMLGYANLDNALLPVSLKTMEISTPYKCVIYVFVLMLLYTMFISVLMLFLNLCFGNLLGVAGVIALNLYGILLNPSIFQKIFHFTGNRAYKANVLCGWLSPLNHATFQMHNFGYDYLPKLSVSFALFLGFIIFFILMSNIAMRKYNFTFIQMGD